MPNVGLCHPALLHKPLHGFALLQRLAAHLQAQAGKAHLPFHKVTRKKRHCMIVRIEVCWPMLLTCASHRYIMEAVPEAQLLVNASPH